MKLNKWILIMYSVPDEPSRIRVAVWRELKGIGAIAVQRSVYAIPQTKKSQNKALGFMRKNPEADFKLFEAQSLDAELSKKLVEQGLKEREEEYKEIIEKTDDFLRDLNKEIQNQNFTYEELEENEADYNKLVRWYAEARDRDWFDSKLKKEVKNKLDECKALLDEFAQKVHNIYNP